LQSIGFDITAEIEFCTSAPSFFANKSNLALEYDVKTTLILMNKKDYALLHFDSLDKQI
jgi:hypothetical protein